MQAAFRGPGTVRRGECKRILVSRVRLVDGEGRCYKAAVPHRKASTIVKLSRRKTRKNEFEPSLSRVASDNDGTDCEVSFYGNSNKVNDRGLKYPISFDADSTEGYEGRYYVYRSHNLTMELPSVTTVLSETQPSGSYFALKRWRQSIEDNHGEGSFHHYRERLLHRGTHFHKLLEEWLSLKLKTAGTSEMSGTPEMSGKPERSGTPETSGTAVFAGDNCLETKQKVENYNIPEMDHDPHLLHQSVRSVISDISDILSLESVVVHLGLGYMGRVDCIAKYQGKLSVIDWKTSYKPRPHLKDMYDGPTQAVAYAGAINSDCRYPFVISNVVLVAVYANGDPCDVHVLSEEDCLKVWSKWTHRLRSFKTQFGHDLTNVY